MPVRRSATDQGPFLGHYDIPDDEFVAAGALQSDHIPIGADCHFVGRHHGNTRKALGCVAFHRDADPDQVRCGRAAAERPYSVDDNAVGAAPRRLQREKPACVHHVGSIRIDLPKHLNGECGEITSGTAEACHPTCGAVHLGNALDHAAKLRRRSLLAAETLGDHCSIDAKPLKAVDDVVWDLLRDDELRPARPDVGEQARQSYPG